MTSIRPDCETQSNKQKQNPRNRKKMWFLLLTSVTVGRRRREEDRTKPRTITNVMFLNLCVVFPPLLVSCETSQSSSAAPPRLWWLHLLCSCVWIHLSLFLFCSSSTWCCLHCLKVNSLQDVLCEECELPRMDSFSSKADQSQPKPGLKSALTHLNCCFCFLLPLQTHVSLLLFS